GSTLQKPVHLCFGMLPEDGLQEIIMSVVIEEKANVSILAHCTFPNAKNITHKMDANIVIKEGAHYSYVERHVHAPGGIITVVPHAIVTVEKHATFKTDFELLRGKAGIIDINYETTCHEYSRMEMNAKVNGIANDDITIREIGHLKGEGAVGVLTTRIAVRDNAKAAVYNTLTAHAPYARGHVDCKEIIQDNGIAKAIPVVEVYHPKAHVTHEAAIGSVDDKQLQTLMARGLDEDQAVDLIIQGLLS
ncbi:MAG: SufD family Fe-S cluster assembly protein, partial [Spirochaetes bacterium]|nr:SufD family Fe-S cluster assembly protein [Spirochaetota bacterium]